MGRPRRGIGAELLAVTLIAGCLAATLAAVISVHRRQPPRVTKAPAVVLAATAAPVVSAPKPAQPLPPPPPPAPVDPTRAILVDLATAEAEQRAEAEKAARRIAALESATKAAKAESGRWSRGIALTRAQLDAREAVANRLEGQAEMVAFERDALARRRDLVKEALQRDRDRPSYAVLPHRGPHGTWQRPIVIECKGDGVTLRPNGPSFDVVEIASPFGRGGNRFAMAVSREAVRVQRQTAPDGEEVVPYIFFIIRPDGVRSYYEARTRLERIGIAFGYELADAEWAIDVPDLDDPATWDGSPPPLNLDASVAADLSGPRGDGSGPAGKKGDIDNAFVWPKSPGGTGDEGGRGGIVGLASPGSSDGPSARSTGGSGRVGAGFGSAGSGGGGAGLGSGLADADRPGGRRGGFGDGDGGTSDDPSGGAGRGSGLGGGESAWGRLNRPYDPTRPVGLASLDRDGAGLGGTERAGRPYGGAGGSAGTSRMGDGAGSVGDRSEGGAGGGNGGGNGGRGPGGSGRDGASGSESQGGGNPGQAGQGRSAGGGGAGRGIVSAGGTGSPGVPGDGQATGSSGSELGEAGGQGGLRSPLGDLGRTARPIELVLACGSRGVAVYPGDYRVTKATLTAKDDLLLAQLRAIVRHREQADPAHPLHPSVRFVIEPGGRETYSVARAQLALAGLGWPTSTQFSGGDVFRLFSTDDW